MAMRRYARTPVLGFGTHFSTSRVIEVIRLGVADGSIGYTTSELREGDRLDIIAGREYGDAALWWIIAAASGIGWGLQVPPGTMLLIPRIIDVTPIAG